MKKSLYISFLFMVTITWGCKHMTTEVDSEKPYTLYVLDNNTGALTDMPFSRVWGFSRPNLTDITNSMAGIQLPMNIAADSSRFFFTSTYRTDTLTLYYNRVIGPGPKAFEVGFYPSKTRTSFKLFTTKCISSASPDCGINEAYLVWGQRPFTLFVVHDTASMTPGKDTLILVNKPFKRITDEHNVDLQDISNVHGGIKLPLDVQADSAAFYFYPNIGTKKDTLVIYYTPTLVIGNQAFSVNYNIKYDRIKTSLKIVHDTITNCNNLNPCYGNQDLSAATYR